MNNYLINGNFDLWQRGITFTIPLNAKWSNLGIGTTLTAQTELIADRWFLIDTQVRDGGSTGNIQAYREIFSNADSDVLGSSKNYLTIANQITGISGGYCYVENKQEDCKKFSNLNFNFSFYAKATNGITGITMACYFRQAVEPNVNEYSTTIGSAIDVQPYWSLHTINFASPFSDFSGLSGNNYFGIGFRLNPESTISIASVKLDTKIGSSVPTPILITDPEQEKIKQSRYYYTTYPVGVLPGSTTLKNGNDLNPVYFTTTPNYSYNHKFDLPMYKQPTVTVYSPSSGVVGDGYNKTAGKDMRLTSGTRGWNLATRFSPTGAATLVATGNTYGVQLDISSGAVVFDDILVHVVADADFDFIPNDRGLET